MSVIVASPVRSIQPRWRRIHHITRVASNSNSASANPVAMLASNVELSAMVEGLRFPPGIDYAFGYGSGVFRQQPSSTSEPNDNIASSSQVDIIIAVGNPRAWHKRNIQRHSEHYSLMARIGGPQFVAWLQENFGAKLYFHPFVDVVINANNGDNVQCSQSKGTMQTENPKTILSNAPTQRQIKYGVVSTDDLIHDLIHWDYLYLAGRMHKPIVPIDLSPKLNLSERPEEEPIDRADEIEDAQRINLLSATSASLLLNGANAIQQSFSSMQSFPVGQLYNTIASLSYTGDFRMQTGAEDPNKVKKLVETPGMMSLWENKYSETLGDLQSSGLLSIVDACRATGDLYTDTNDPGSGEKHLECNFTDVAVRKQLVQNLPLRLRKHCDQIVGTGVCENSIRKGSLVLHQELANIVGPAAKYQSIKGFFTAGVAKSWRYATAKFAKGRGK